ncbi:MAG: orotidine-5'-phosphate decarboxylase [Eubacteriales bacterium]|nr:orotidine-5'-phosphate decarboxylase [Bacillota bacterium]
MPSFKNPLIVALDFDSKDKALEMVKKLAPHAGGFKVGMQLYYSAGPDCVRALKEAGANLFVDLKLHDIPNTVAGASRALTRLGASIFNVHAAGGMAMMLAAVEASGEEAAKLGRRRPLVTAVTVLTSIGQDAFSREVGFPCAIRERVVAWASLARDAGLDGVVASPQEIGAIREACGPGFAIITPGVRPAGAAAGDQKRVMTPGEAVRLGADYLVVGRPITNAPDPVEAALAILEEMGNRELPAG